MFTRIAASPSDRGRLGAVFSIFQLFFHLGLGRVRVWHALELERDRSKKACDFCHGRASFYGVAVEKRLCRHFFNGLSKKF